VRYSEALVTTFDAILPAGGTISAEFAAKVGTPNKALIRFHNRSILERTLDALNDSGRVSQTVVIGTKEVLESHEAAKATQTLPAGGSGPENMLKGLKHIINRPNPPKKVMIVTTDLPFLTPEIIVDFIDRCPSDRDICVPLVTKQQFTTRFPNATATFIRLRDNEWTTGGAFLIDVQAFQVAMPHIERLFENRKSKLGMVKLLGPLFLFKFLRKTLIVPDVEAKIQSMLGCSGGAVLDSPPELAYDIDDLEDYNYAMDNLNALDRR